MMIYNNFIIRGMVLVILSVSCKSKQSESDQPAGTTSYQVITLLPQAVELQSVFSAVLKGQEDVDIKPRVDGFIEAVYVDEGAKVSKGQALFKINSPSSVKNLEEAQSNCSTAKLDVERLRPLAEKNIISPVQLESYKNTLAAAEAALEQAKATMSWVTVTSPVDGVVGTISYRLGSLVDNSSVLTTVSNTTNVIAYFSMNEKELYEFMEDLEGKTKDEKIKNIPNIKLLLSNGHEYEESGHIATISGIVDQTSGTVNLRASFPNKNGLLLSGTSGNVIIPKHMNEALVIPQNATFTQQNKVLAYKVQGDSVVQEAITVASTPDGKSYVILNGLESDDKIVSDDIMSLSNGKKIKIEEF